MLTSAARILTSQTTSPTAARIYAELRIRIATSGSSSEIAIRTVHPVLAVRAAANKIKVWLSNFGSLGFSAFCPPGPRASFMIAAFHTRKLLYALVCYMY